MVGGPRLAEALPKLTFALKELRRSEGGTGWTALEL